jgi:osmoprotectant transport system substrate-binding protein
MKSLREPRRIVAGLAALALVVTACGGTTCDDTATTMLPQTPTATATTTATWRSRRRVHHRTRRRHVGRSLADLDFSGLTVNVGSKDFVEQFVLGQLLIVGLEAGGATTVDNVNLGGTVVNRDALLNNEIDAYFEYNGTGWTVHLGRTTRASTARSSPPVCASMDLAENDIRWLGVSPFNNTYGFATAGDGPATGLDLQGMADYVAENPTPRCAWRPSTRTVPTVSCCSRTPPNFQIPDDQIEILETGVIYDETASGNCTFGEIFTTDGRIPALGSTWSRTRACTSCTTCR